MSKDFYKKIISRLIHTNSQPFVISCHDRLLSPLTCTQEPRDNLKQPMNRRQSWAPRDENAEGFRGLETDPAVYMHDYRHVIRGSASGNLVHAWVRELGLRNHDKTMKELLY